MRVVPMGKDLRQNPDIQILLSIDPTSFPLGTGLSNTKSGAVVITL